MSRLRVVIDIDGIQSKPFETSFDVVSQRLSIYRFLDLLGLSVPPHSDTRTDHIGITGTIFKHFAKHSFVIALIVVCRSVYMYDPGIECRGVDESFRSGDRSNQLALLVADWFPLISLP